MDLLTAAGVILVSFVTTALGWFAIFSLGRVIWFYVQGRQKTEKLSLRHFKTLGWICVLFGLAVAGQSASRLLGRPAAPTAADSLSPSDREAAQLLMARYEQSKIESLPYIQAMAAFDAGTITARELDRRTALPEAALAASYSSMGTLAQNIGHPELRSFLQELTSTIVARHRGLVMIVEGHVSGNSSQVERGGALFVKYRERLIAVAAEIAGAAEDDALASIFGPTDIFVGRLGA